ncbi:MAG: DNA repair protein RecO [Alphaproteobacteria bacterium]
MITVTDQAILLNKRRYGERGLVMSVLTQHHGKRSGFGYSWSKHAAFQKGMTVTMTWKARSDEHLGTMTLEGGESLYPPLMGHPQKAIVMDVLCAYTHGLLPDHDPHPDVFEALQQAKAHLFHTGSELRVLADFERFLLTVLGFGCDVSQCAATGGTDDLAYISPKTGRAVSRVAGAPYHHRLMALPAFWIQEDAEVSPEDLCQALRITGHFLQTCLFGPRSLTLPDLRAHLMPVFQGDRAFA